MGKPLKHKRTGPKSTRAGCLLCKPHKLNGVHEERASVLRRLPPDQDRWRHRSGRTKGLYRVIELEGWRSHAFQVLSLKEARRLETERNGPPTAATSPKLRSLVAIHGNEAGLAYDEAKRLAKDLFKAPAPSGA